MSKQQRPRTLHTQRFIFQEHRIAEFYSKHTVTNLYRDNDRISSGIK